MDLDYAEPPKPAQWRSVMLYSVVLLTVQIVMIVLPVFLSVFGNWALENPTVSSFIPLASLHINACRHVEKAYRIYVLLVIALLFGLNIVLWVRRRLRLGSCSPHARKVFVCFSALNAVLLWLQLVLLSKGSP
jgi:hypothetical protein